MKALIKLENISKIYYLGINQVTVLKKLSLVINNGDFISIMGASGSGKSTLLHILGCLDLIDTGNYYFKDILISQYSEKNLAVIRNLNIGFVFQQFFLFPLIAHLKIQNYR